MGDFNQDARFSEFGRGPMERVTRHDPDGHDGRIDFFQQARRRCLDQRLPDSLLAIAHPVQEAGPDPLRVGVGSTFLQRAFEPLDNGR